MSRWIDADIYVTATLYDDEHEDYRDERMTIADCLDRFTDEGCPTEGKPKQGEWIAYRGMQPPELRGKHYCSNCYHAIHLASNGNVHNYCPNCGAKMDGAESEEE